jgi:hypothetical protein
LSSLSGAVEVLLQKYKKEDICDGDVFIANDPYSGGGSHLPDIVLLKPVFYEGKLAAFMVNTGHHADRSRKGPTIYDEGLTIPLVKLYSKGELVEDVLELIMLNFQMKYERKGDLNAQILTNQFGAEKFIELIDKIGFDTYEEFCKKWLEYGEKKARCAIAPFFENRALACSTIYQDNTDMVDSILKSEDEPWGTRELSQPLFKQTFSAFNGEKLLVIGNYPAILKSESIMQKRVSEWYEGVPPMAYEVDMADFDYGMYIYILSQYRLNVAFIDEAGMRGVFVLPAVSFLLENDKN